MLLLDLSNETLSQILGQSDILGPRDFCNVACTCKRLSPLTEPLIYREIRGSQGMIWASIGWKRLAYIIKKFDDNPRRTVWVRSAAFAFQPHEAEWSAAVVDLLSRCTFIHTLSLRHGPIYGKYDDRNAHPQENFTFAHFLGRLFVGNLNSLTLDDCRITFKDVTKAFTRPNLTHLRINRYDTSISGVLNLPSEVTFSPTKLKKFEFWFCALPRGPYVQGLLTNHPYLEDFTWVADFRLESLWPNKTREILPAFLDIMSTVTTCYMTAVEPEGLMLLGLRYSFDFSQFKRLKELNLHDRWLFGPPRWTQKRWDRCLLPSLLPESLEDLTVS
jgi:hypothetical protein